MSLRSGRLRDITEEGVRGVQGVSGVQNVWERCGKQIALVNSNMFLFVVANVKASAGNRFSKIGARVVIMAS
jgi:hypothetical protein